MSEGLSSAVAGDCEGWSEAWSGTGATLRMMTPMLRTTRLRMGMPMLKMTTVSTLRMSVRTLEMTTVTR